MKQVHIVLDNLEEKDILAKAPINNNIYFTFIDDIKQARRFKASFAAKKSPFAVVYSNDKPIKAFYSEYENVIESLIKYLNEEN